MNLIFRPRLIPLDGNWIMIAGEFVSREPQLESQVRRCYDDANFELADVEHVASGKTRTPLVFLNQLVLLHAGEIALNIAELDSASLLQAPRQEAGFGVGDDNLRVPRSSCFVGCQSELEGFD